jgi:hypothetical protein
MRYGAYPQLLRGLSEIALISSHMKSKTENSYSLRAMAAKMFLLYEEILESSPSLGVIIFLKIRLGKLKRNLLASCLGFGSGQPGE